VFSRWYNLDIVNSTLRIAIVLLCLIVGFESEAKAYTDPGTGALIWQMVAAGFVGAMFYFRRIRTTISDFLKKRGDHQ
jgi:hypothetical protein